MRQRLPSMWRYFSACVYSETARRDDIAYLAQSILNRAKWALEGRDDIGTQFYRAQNNTTADRMTYHVGHLAAVLMGAFDAAARVAARAYDVRIKVARVRFRNPEFRQELRKRGAADLADRIASREFLDTTQVLNTTRNAIHGAGQSPVSWTQVGEPQRSLILVPATDAANIEAALQTITDREDWGFLRLHQLCFEPYSFALTACRQAFHLLNDVAHLTDVSRLFPNGSPIVTIDQPPTDWDDPPGFLARIDLLS